MHTEAGGNSLHIVICHVVLDPVPVVVALLLRPRVSVKHLRDGSVSDEARRKSNVESQYVFRLPDVQRIPYKTCQQAPVQSSRTIQTYSRGQV